MHALFSRLADSLCHSRMSIRVYVTPLARASIAIHEIADFVVTGIIAEFVLAVLRVDGWFQYDLWDVWDR